MIQHFILEIKVQAQSPGSISFPDPVVVLLVQFFLTQRSNPKAFCTAFNGDVHEEGKTYLATVEAQHRPEIDAALPLPGQSLREPF